jgi:hypothetical protein
VTRVVLPDTVNPYLSPATESSRSASVPSLGSAVVCLLLTAVVLLFVWSPWGGGITQGSGPGWTGSTVSYGLFEYYVIRTQNGRVVESHFRPDGFIVSLGISVLFAGVSLWQVYRLRGRTLKTTRLDSATRWWRNHGVDTDG